MDVWRAVYEQTLPNYCDTHFLLYVMGTYWHIALYHANALEVAYILFA